MHKTITILSGIIIIVGISAMYVFGDYESYAIFERNKAKNINSFNKCVDAGFPVMESYPRQCRAGEKFFIEELNEEEIPEREFFETEEEVIVPSSGIKGRVFLGPTCPVEREREDCSSKPFKASLRIYNEENIFLKTVITNDKGEFETALDPGRYIISSDGKSVFPRLSSQVFFVGSNRFTSLELYFDSGIR